MKWSWGEDGQLEIWKDGEPVFQRRGPNAYHDERATYLKIGIYKWLYKRTPEESQTDGRVIYVDEVRVGGSDAEYRTIAP